MIKPSGRYYLALSAHLEILDFFWEIADDQTISSYFKSYLFEPWLKSYTDDESPKLHQLWLEAFEEAQQAALT